MEEIKTDQHATLMINQTSKIEAGTAFQANDYVPAVGFVLVIVFIYTMSSLLKLNYLAGCNDRNNEVVNRKAVELKFSNTRLSIMFLYAATSVLRMNWIDGQQSKLCYR